MKTLVILNDPPGGEVLVCGTCVDVGAHNAIIAEKVLVS